MLSELGRFPLVYYILSNLLTYWHRLESKESSDNEIIFNAYFIFKFLYDQNTPCRSVCVSYIIDDITEITKTFV